MLVYYVYIYRNIKNKYIKKIINQSVLTLSLLVLIQLFVLVLVKDYN